MVIWGKLFFDETWAISGSGRVHIDFMEYPKPKDLNVYLNPCIKLSLPISKFLEKLLRTDFQSRGSLTKPRQMAFIVALDQGRRYFVSNSIFYGAIDITRDGRGILVSLSYHWIGAGIRGRAPR